MLSLVPTSVLVSSSRKRAASASPPPSSRAILESSAESLVDLQDNVSLMSCRVYLILLLPRGLRSCCCKVRFCICKVFCYKVRYFLLPLSVFLLLKSPFLLLQSLLAACLRTGKFPAVLVLVILSSNVLILNSSGTLVLSPAPLKKWIRSPLSIRSFREICSSSGSEEESVFYAV